MTFPLPPQSNDCLPHKAWGYTCPAMDGRLRGVASDELSPQVYVRLHDAEHHIWRLLVAQGIDPTGLRVIPWAGAMARRASE